ncbi:MAG: nicotinate phosphoribosyltransferase [Candidatus Nanohaloarchaea archaeon]|nr:nicotinate phosphoribosyltransferase [Candidatus Nanohaloarchaea archaeon]
MTEPTFGALDGGDLPLFTDLYELTMLQGYFEQGHNPRATFDLFVRDLPPDRGYLIAAGLEQVVAYLDGLSFDGEAIDYLAEQGFNDGFLDWLAGFEFTGDVRAVPEGTAVFPDEPIIEVTATIMQAQLLETMLINQVAFQSLIATKAARMRHVVDEKGDGQSLVDFGSRRAHGTDAGVKAARAAYIGGFDGTSNVAAGRDFDIKVFGTMAHSWIQSFETEEEAFRAYVESYGEDSILLVDTYDTLEGAELAADVADEMDVDIRGVRIDSGDLAGLSRQVAGETGLDVFVSSGLDEYAITEFFEDGGVATGFGVGTNLVTSADAPTLEGVYKLVAVERDGELRPTMKLSQGKVTYPGRKTVHRVERDGRFQKDVIALQDEDIRGEELLVDIYDAGDRVYDLPSLDAVRSRRERSLSKLPEGVQRIRSPATYPVSPSEGLERETERLREELAR